jgi:hypothetical protein
MPRAMGARDLRNWLSRFVIATWCLLKLLTAADAM